MTHDGRWTALALAVGFAAGLAAIGCIDSVTLCDAVTCAAGCCDERGICRNGIQDSACGTGGARCTACVDGTVCVEQACGMPPPPPDAGPPPVMCELGKHRCGDVCVPDDSPLTCGSRCVPCPAPDGGEPTCVAGACRFTCAAGLVLCVDGCCPPARVIDIAAGGDRTMAIVEDGGVRSWGSYSFRLGPVPFGMTIRPGDVPLEVPAAPPSRSISVGDAHHCVLHVDGGASCWGDNLAGEVGTSEVGFHLDPVTVEWGPGWPPNDRAASISAGSSTTCILGTSGAAGCWGRVSNNGLRGTGSLSNAWAPSPAQGLASGVVALSHSANHALALLEDGGVVGWGANESGTVVSAPTPLRYLTPVRPGPLPDTVFPVQVSAGTNHSCALAGDGGVWCWGTNQYGECGVPPITTRPFILPEPVSVAGLPGDVTAVMACNFFTCALTRSGSVWCWGRNQGGQLGDGTMTDRYTPAEATGFEAPVTKLECGNFHACALDADAGVWCWGSNMSGQLGLGAGVTSRPTPTRVPVP